MAKISQSLTPRLNAFLWSMDVSVDHITAMSTMDKMAMAVDILKRNGHPEATLPDPATVTDASGDALFNTILTTVDASWSGRVDLFTSALAKLSGEDAATDPENAARCIVNMAAPPLPGTATGLPPPASHAWSPARCCHARCVPARSVKLPSDDDHYTQTIVTVETDPASPAIITRTNVDSDGNKTTIMYSFSGGVSIDLTSMLNMEKASDAIGKALAAAQSKGTAAVSVTTTEETPKTAGK